MAVLDLHSEHLRIVREILQRGLPPDARVWAFGSRATGRARRYSDLDLAIDAGRPLRLDEHAELAEAFTESDLPYKVDVVDWRNLGEAFRARIAGDRLRLVPIESEPATTASARDQAQPRSTPAR